MIEDDIKAGWHFVETEAVDIYNVLSPLIAAPLKAFEQDVVQALWGAIAGFITKIADVLKATSLKAALQDLETAFLNTIQLTSQIVFRAAISVGSQILQVILGVFQAKALAA